VRSRLLATVLATLPVPVAFAAQTSEKVIDVRTARPPAGNTFEALWSVYRKAQTKGDSEAIDAALREVRRLRVERNIKSLEPYALARVSEGLASLKEAEIDKATVAFRSASVLDPHLPDAYFGLAAASMKGGISGFPSGIKEIVKGTTARLRTTVGWHRLVSLITPAVFLALLGTITVVALALLLRHGVLLFHDIEESLGPARSPIMAPGIFAVLLLAPVIALQGYAWLPLWWASLLFVYLAKLERLAVLALLLACVPVGPIVKTLESRTLAAQNPLFGAGVLAIEGGPDTRAVSILEDGVRRYPDDRDIVYLLAAQYKKSGRYEDATAFYLQILQREPNDTYALNNLANLSFAGGEFQAAIPRYLQAIATNPPPEIAATLYYNLALSHVQRFERQLHDEARSHAERLADGLIDEYDTLWKYEFKNENAVVDLGLKPEELWAKFEGARQGVGRKNLAGVPLPSADALGLLRAGANRFAGAIVLCAAAIFLLSRWRGPRMFTMRCVKCGTPFCRRCQIGAATEGLCTQCHHLFIVRDGVSGSVRNQKLLEVQKEDAKREKIFRIMSLLAPGSGHVYARKTLSGVAFVFVWSFILALALLGGRILPLTESSSTLARPWGLGLGMVLLLVVYVVANRARPDFEDLMLEGLPFRRSRTA